METSEIKGAPKPMCVCMSFSLSLSACVHEIHESKFKLVEFSVKHQERIPSAQVFSNSAGMAFVPERRESAHILHHLE